MSLPRQHTALVVIDVQERLFPAMDADHREEVMRNIKVLTTATPSVSACPLGDRAVSQGARATPCRKWSKTLCPGVEPIEKVAFSCWAVGAFRSRLEATGAPQRSSWSGIEAHVCVLMSALDLLAEGYAVHVVADAVTSRSQANWRLAMDQLRQAGAVVTTTRDGPVPAPGPGRHRGIPRARAPYPLRVSAYVPRSWPAQSRRR